MASCASSSPSPSIPSPSIPSPSIPSPSIPSSSPSPSFSSSPPILPPHYTTNQVVLLHLLARSWFFFPGVEEYMEKSYGIPPTNVLKGFQKGAKKFQVGGGKEGERKGERGEGRKMGGYLSFFRSLEFLMRGRGFKGEERDRLRGVMELIQDAEREGVKEGRIVGHGGKGIWNGYCWRYGVCE